MLKLFLTTTALLALSTSAHAMSLLCNTPYQLPMYVVVDVDLQVNRFAINGRPFPITHINSTPLWLIIGFMDSAGFESAFSYNYRAPNAPLASGLHHAGHMYVCRENGTFQPHLGYH
jgi:hypothetical protein